MVVQTVEALIFGEGKLGTSGAITTGCVSIEFGACGPLTLLFRFLKEKKLVNILEKRKKMVLLCNVIVYFWKLTVPIFFKRKCEVIKMKEDDRNDLKNWRAMYFSVTSENKLKINQISMQ